MRLIAIALATVLLSACAALPTQQEMAAADYGGPVTQPDAESAAKNFLSSRLKDPYSAVWQCQPVQKGYFRDSRISGGHLHYGWEMNCMVNAKNAFGGYVGSKSYMFLFRDGSLVSALGEEDLGSGVTMMQKML